MPSATLAVSGTQVMRGGDGGSCNDRAALTLSAAASSCIARICNFLRRQPHFKQRHHDHHDHHQNHHGNDNFWSTCACSGRTHSSHSAAARSAVLTQTVQQQVLLPPSHLIVQLHSSIRSHNI
jgi:hypothetical protein